MKQQHFSFEYIIPMPPKGTETETRLLDKTDICLVELRTIGKEAKFAEFEKRENYAGRTSGSPLALEAEIFLSSRLHPEWTSMRIGIPLSELPDAAEYSIRYTGPALQLLADGQVLTEDFPFGDPPGLAAGEPLVSCQRKICKFCGDTTLAAHGWTPAGLNSWVGDVSVGFFGGEFHVFYLFDRRHHGSKFGQGGHAWAHMVTRDFRNWRDDGLILPFTEQWQTFGTGTPFELDGKIALSYGFHTERILPEGMALHGATWAESYDGKHFTPAEKVFHETRNPSVYNLPGGGFRLFTGYNGGSLEIWEADRWPEFRKVRSNVVPCGDESFMKNCLDCPSWFEWHERNYLLIGFSGMWSSESPRFENAFDLAANGLDIYDGLNVPMVSAFGDDRRILAGWLPLKGWGGLLGLRELVYHSDGVLGIRWLDEAMPGKAEPFAPLPPGGDIGNDFYLEVELEANENLRLCFESEGAPIEFRLDAGRKRAVLAPAELAETTTMREHAACGEKYRWREYFSIENLRGLEQPFKVRLLIRHERKWTGCVIDAEIAGCRTMMQYFPGCAIRSATGSKPEKTVWAPAGKARPSILPLTS